MSMPHELAFGDVYFSPLVPVFTLALIGAWLTGLIMNKTGVARYIAYPSLTFLTLMTAYIMLMDALWIRI
jgi:Protein of unknown function (DUF1656)